MFQLITESEILECSTLASARDAYREASGRKELWLYTALDGDDPIRECLEDSQTYDWYRAKRS